VMKDSQVSNVTAEDVQKIRDRVTNLWGEDNDKPKSTIISSAAEIIKKVRKNMRRE